MLRKYNRCIGRRDTSADEVYRQMKYIGKRDTLVSEVPCQAKYSSRRDTSTGKGAHAPMWVCARARAYIGAGELQAGSCELEAASWI